MQKNVFYILFLSIFLLINCFKFYADEANPIGISNSYTQQEGGIFSANSGVGPSGSVSYSYPMGGAGANYSSAGGGGWSIESYSSITRDSSWGVPNYNDNDIFLLDGEELVYASGTNPKLYHTKNESYAKVEYYNPGTSSSYWKITTADGSKSYYGAWKNGSVANDARILGVGKSSSHPRMWAIKIQTDAAEYNIIKYVYYNEDTTTGAVALKLVISGKTSASKFSCTYYVHEERMNQIIGYYSGSKTTNRYKVKAIVNIMGCDGRGNGGYVTSAYKINWVMTQYTMKELITSITPYGNDVAILYETYNSEDGCAYTYATDIVYGTGSTLPTTAFLYGEMNLGFEQGKFADISDSKRIRKSTCGVFEFAYSDIIDMNGDGLPDRVTQEASNNITILFNNSSSFNSSASWADPVVAQHGDYRDLRRIKNNYEWGWVFTDFFDINGDGMPDRMYADGDTASDKKLYSYLNIGNESGFGGRDDRWNNPALDSTRLTFGNRTYHDQMDMNGDGFIDRISQRGNLNLTLYKNTGSGFSSAATWNSYEGDYMRYGTVSTVITHDYMDMNGDGLPDRVIQSGGDIKIYFNNGNGFDPNFVTWAKVGPSEHTLSSSDTSGVKVALKDMNGDGLPDRVQQCNNTNLNIWFNTGSGFYPTAMAVNSIKGGRIVDVVKTTNNSFDTSDYIDMNGDGLLDRVYWENNTIKVYINTSVYPDEGMLKKVCHPQGGYTEYSYQPIDRSINSGYKMKRWIVEEVKNNDGMGNTYTTKYDFYNGYFDKETREDRGFGQVKMTDPAGNYTLTYYKQDSTFAGCVEKTVSYNHEGYIYSYIYNNYFDLATRSGHYGYYIKQNRSGLSGAIGQVIVKAIMTTDSYNYVVSGSTDSDAGSQPGGTGWYRTRNYTGADSSSVDNYGNVLITTSGLYDNGWGLDKVETRTLYVCDTGDWLFLPINIQTYTYNSAGSFVQCSRKDIYYDTNPSQNTSITKPIVTFTKDYYNSSNYTAKRIEYDSYGNVSRVYDHNGYYAGTQYYTEYTYDTQFRSFLIKTVAPSVDKYGGGTILFESYNYYDTVTLINTEIDIISNNITRGQLTRTRNVNGVYSDVLYDVFGRIIKTWSPPDNMNSPTTKAEYINASLDGTNGTDIMIPAHIISGVKDGGTDSVTISGKTFTGYITAIDYGVQKKTEAEDSLGNRQWRTTESWSWIDTANNKSISAARAPYFSSSASYTRNNTNPPYTAWGSQDYAYTISYLDQTKGAVVQAKDYTGNSSYVYSRLLKIYAIDSLNHFAISESSPMTNEGISYEFEGTWYDSYITSQPSYYSKTITKSTYDQKKITDGMNVVVSTQNFDWMGRKTSMTDVDMGTWSYSYDYSGNIVSQTDAKSQTITMEYDKLNRLTKKTLPGTGNYSQFIYDYYNTYEGNYAKAKLARVFKYENGSELLEDAYKYDERGRTAGSWREFGNNSSTHYYSYYSYDSANRNTGIRYPGESNYSSNYFNLGGDIKQIKDPANQVIVNNVYYDNKGKISTIKYGNGAQTYYTYGTQSTNYRLSEILHVNSNGNAIMRTKYYYDSVGNITNIDDMLNNSYDRIFNYDELNRLMGQTNSGFVGGAWYFNYDKNGNITMRQNNTTVKTYTYYPNTHKVQSSGDYSYNYDNNGNMTSQSSGYVYTYDAENNITNVTKNGNTIGMYYYDSSGNRTIKIDNGAEIVATYYIGAHYESEWGTTPIKYYYLNGMRVCMDKAGTKTWFHNDHLQSTSKTTNANGLENSSTVYNPFGTDAVASGTQQKYKFTGKEKDSTGLYYYGARYYDPVLCRFIQPDTIYDSGTQGLNRYSYCLNNPVRYNDPSGHAAARPTTGEGGGNASSGRCPTPTKNKIYLPIIGGGGGVSNVSSSPKIPFTMAPGMSMTTYQSPELYATGVINDADVSNNSTNTRSNKTNIKNGKKLKNAFNDLVSWTFFDLGPEVLKEACNFFRMFNQNDLLKLEYFNDSGIKYGLSSYNYQGVLLDEIKTGTLHYNNSMRSPYFLSSNSFKILSTTSHILNIASMSNDAYDVIRISGEYQNSSITRTEAIAQKVAAATSFSRTYTSNYVAVTPLGITMNGGIIVGDLITQIIANKAGIELPTFNEFVGKSAAIVDTLGWQGAWDAIRYEMTGGEQGRHSQDVLQDLGLID